MLRCLQRTKGAAPTKGARRTPDAPLFSASWTTEANAVVAPSTRHTHHPGDAGRGRPVARGEHSRRAGASTAAAGRHAAVLSRVARRRLVESCASKGRCGANGGKHGNSGANGLSPAWSHVQAAPERPRRSRQRVLHDDETAALQIFNEALRHNLGHDLVGVVNVRARLGYCRQCSERKDDPLTDTNQPTTPISSSRTNSGPATDFDSAIRRFESSPPAIDVIELLPCQSTPGHPPDGTFDATSERRRRSYKRTAPESNSARRPLPAELLKVVGERGAWRVPQPRPRSVRSGADPS